MIFFPDTTLHRYTLLNVEGGGIYGETIQEYKYSDDILVDFQNESNQEIAHDYGVDLTDLYKIYVDLNTTITDYDRLEDDNGNKYDILGGVKVYKKFHKYKKIHLVRVREEAQ